MLSGVSIGIAYLFHSTGIYVFLVFLAHAIFYKKLNKKATFLFFGFLIVFGLENTFYYGSTGQWLYRQKILTQTHFGAENLVSVAAKKTFETVPDNPFKGTLLGDSWILEPFRQLLLNPVNSVIYYLYFVVNLLLIIRKDRNILLLNLLFWPLFLYYSYGSPNPLSYNPLRRLPRYSLPYLIPVTITISYGIEKILIKRYVRYSLIILYILISIFCLSIKGGEMGQRFYQSKFFYDFIKDHPNENYITDKHTYVGLLLLNRYRKFEKIEAIETTKFFSLINDNEFLRQHGDSYLLINSPFIYGFEDIKYDIGLLKLIRSNENKPRR
ncbi:MAG: hypothetical protein GTN76_01040, partial [Candidatus Aenigmarchaeota archaeon]|nr:hypothetical protein [Candidatus Aenigmarchaeota archaeon]